MSLVVQSTLNDLKKDQVKYENEIKTFESRKKDVLELQYAEINIKIQENNASIDTVADLLIKTKQTCKKLIMKFQQWKRF